MYRWNPKSSRNQHFTNIPITDSIKMTQRSSQDDNLSKQYDISISGNAIQAKFREQHTMVHSTSKNLKAASLEKSNNNPNKETVDSTTTLAQFNKLNENSEQYTILGPPNISPLGRPEKVSTVLQDTAIKSKFPAMVGTEERR